MTEPDDEPGEKTWEPETETRPGAENNPVTTIDYNDKELWSRVTNARGVEIFYDYDNIGRLARIEKENGGETQYAVIGVENDAWNNITAITDPNGNTTHYAYDVTGRLTEITHPLYNGRVHTRTM